MISHQGEEKDKAKHFFYRNTMSARQSRCLLHFFFFRPVLGHPDGTKHFLKSHHVPGALRKATHHRSPYLPATRTQLQGFFHINLAQLPFSHRIYHSVFSISLSKVASHFIFCPWKPSRQYLLKGKNSITEIILLSQVTSGLWTSSSCHC